MRIVRIFPRIALVLLIVLSGVSLWGWYGPLPLNWFFNRSFLKMVLDSPETLSQLRLLESVGIKFHQDELDDVSIAAGDRTIEKLRSIHEELESFDVDRLDRQEQLSYEIADWMLTRLSAAADRWRFHDYPVNQLFGAQNEFPSFMESAHQVHSVGDAEDYVARLDKVPAKWKQLMEGLREREKRKIRPPRFVVAKVLEEMRNFVHTKPEANILYTSLEAKLREAKLEEREQTRLLALAKTSIEKRVYPAYRTLIAYFDELYPRTNDDAGVWKLPDGKRFYADLLELYTTTKRSPAEIHALGLSEVARIQSEMRGILNAQGYESDTSIGDTMRALAAEPRFSFSDDQKGRAEILKTYQTIIDEIGADLKPFFLHKPKMGVEVKRVPEFKQKTAPGGYYELPPLDGSKPGVFYANLYDIKATPRFDMRTLAYHEAIPGHHFQVALAQEQTDLPLFRRLAPFTAYIEGWALYAERLAWEAGFQKDPFDNLGRLQAELMRAVRLVVDTGLHEKRWTREQAIDYMAQNTGLAMSDVVAEVERYIVMPAQACTYKLGMMEILRLREQARRELGKAFDIRRFHEVVLDNGPMPLFILERVVNDWVKQEKARAKAS
jgi:uncharacterized protein (DUF885 family)